MDVMQHTVVALLLMWVPCCVLAAFDPSQLAGQAYMWSRDRSRPSSSKPASHAALLSAIYKYRPKSNVMDTLAAVTNTDTGIPPVAPYPVCSQPALACAEGKYRTADGTCNNLNQPTWGATGWPQVRLLPAQYHDGRTLPRTMSVRHSKLPSARQVSQSLHAADSQVTESPDLSHLFTVWGQFLDHDVTHTPVARESDGSKLDCCNKPVMYPRRDFYWIQDESQQNTAAVNPNCFPISIQPRTDRFFTSTCMNFVRSKSFAPTPTCQSATREQGNTQTSYVDASQVYGASLGDQNQLRTGFGGQLKSAQNDLLPKNSTTMCTKRPNSGDFCFGSGDPRVNEHPMLSSVHVVFHRLHNVVASQLADLNQHWDDETLFQEARRIVGAVMQHVTYAEYLPLVLGNREMERYNLTLDGATGLSYMYDPDVNPNIINAFSTAAFRFGHSMVNTKNSFGFQKLNLRDMFFHPHFVQHEFGAGLNMVLNGLIRDHSQSRDRFMSKDLTDHLFQTKDGRSLDLAALNIQRGRDHGLPSYNAYRKLCGLPSLQDAIKGGTFPTAPFMDVYRDVDDVDLFTGGLTEQPVEGGVVGPTFSCIIGRQFHNLKFGDRFWYQNEYHAGAFTPEQVSTIERIGMSDILCATTSMTAVQANPFVLPSVGNPVKECSEVPPIDLLAFQEGRSPLQTLPL